MQDSARFSMFSITVFNRSWPIKVYFSTNGIFQLVQRLRFVAVYFPLQAIPQEKMSGVKSGDLAGHSVSSNREINFPGNRFLNTSMLDLVMWQVAPSCCKEDSTKFIVPTKGIKYSFSFSPYLFSFTVMASPLGFWKKKGGIIEVAANAHQAVIRNEGSGASLIKFWILLRPKPVILPLNTSI